AEQAPCGGAGAGSTLEQVEPANLGDACDARHLHLDLALPQRAPQWPALATRAVRRQGPQQAAQRLANLEQHGLAAEAVADHDRHRDAHRHVFAADHVALGG
ncbi:hypothetical protein RZS08_58650, partial [Arthrospira platensis SPKY1]|nr:hypothetical protein [Arthrospira platensis SPKY1]